MTEKSEYFKHLSERIILIDIVLKYNKNSYKVKKGVFMG